ncbi:tRNA (N6-isopentenyl adenosine(37)-C2)-methylthiotransferase MiaB [Chondromyces crocatus]|uniref:tRNA-2-methylthio-N(6)-dimethylallyladenosine synthase n=1 Tax=Chondromyces crocatus TaxID=52 RepID=A0A0K1EEZ2_CHOCO|nr:tRNA (N6-isopentenyl adenosine(37)-C2)-methylthiotransferase MiaB [Chondromyces crocatus]AKT39262.1 dimethylallyladenosine tRNA methylthiotransferase [Chondromyces crocatus]
MPRYAITTFGCQMNVHDSERMREVLRSAGYAEAEGPADADVLVLNTCSVREKAEQKLRSEVGRLARWKQEQPERVLIVAGCVAQQEGEQLLRRMPTVDVVIGPDNIVELPRLLGDLSTGGLPVVRTTFDLDAPRFLPPPTGGSGVTAFVTVMKGCNERCSFCIVPYTRGPERYRSSDEIVAEIASLCASGTREVTLLGQTVNSYRDPATRLPRAEGADPSDPDESEFAALLWRIAAEVPSLKRLRYTSPHPRHLTPSLIRAHAELPILPRHVHMPVQSGSNRMLKRMIRRYTREEYIARTRALCEAAPGLTLSTDIIVGFPGETEEDFEATLSLVETVGFRGLFGFKYSRRPYTPALKLQDDVSEQIKGERLARLFALSEALLGGHLGGLTGSVQEVLVEGPAKAGDLWSGRTSRNEIVHIEGVSELDLVGEVVTVQIIRANKHSLHGELTEAARAAARRARPRPAGRRVLPVVGEGPRAES